MSKYRHFLSLEIIVGVQTLYNNYNYKIMLLDSLCLGTNDPQAVKTTTMTMIDTTKREINGLFFFHFGMKLINFFVVTIDPVTVLEIVSPNKVCLNFLFSDCCSCCCCYCCRSCCCCSCCCCSCIYYCNYFHILNFAIFRPSQIRPFSRSSRLRRSQP